MRTAREQEHGPRPRTALLAAAVLAFGLSAAGCGDAGRPTPAGDDRRPNPSNAAAHSPAPHASPGERTAAQPEPAGASGAAEATDGEAGGETGGETGPEQENSPPQKFEGTAGVTEKKREVSGVAVLREVRAASHPAFDRVVFEFEGDLPGYRLEYVDRPVRQCGSGLPLKVAGDGLLLVRLEPASAHTESGEPTVRDRERRTNLPNMKELKLVCDFEGQVEWVLGLRSPEPYRLSELRNPSRLVLDVKR